MLNFAISALGFTALVNAAATDVPNKHEARAAPSCNSIVCMKSLVFNVGQENVCDTYYALLISVP